MVCKFEICIGGSLRAYWNLIKYLKIAYKTKCIYVLYVLAFGRKRPMLIFWFFDWMKSSAQTKLIKFHKVISMARQSIFNIKIALGYCSKGLHAKTNRSFFSLANRIELMKTHFVYRGHFELKQLLTSARNFHDYVFHLKVDY